MGWNKLIYVGFGFIGHFGEKNKTTLWDKNIKKWISISHNSDFFFLKFWEKSQNCEIQMHNSE